MRIGLHAQMHRQRGKRHILAQRVSDQRLVTLRFRFHDDALQECARDSTPTSFARHHDSQFGSALVDGNRMSASERLRVQRNEADRAWPLAHVFVDEFRIEVIDGVKKAAIPVLLARVVENATVVFAIGSGDAPDRYRLLRGSDNRPPNVSSAPELCEGISCDIWS